ncbi:MAG: hypothetical protein ABWY16_03280 [Pedobacter sp.]|uniref:hypothetical protein n=1 Tax=Pedobacter sp. TaxID=1411316 RepID=UPI003394A5AF
MNLGKRNFKVAKKTLFVFKGQSPFNNIIISSDPGTSFSITTPGTMVPKHHH